MKYYSLNNIKKKNATYNVIFGERSNGKTYAMLKDGITDFIKNKHQMGYVRRWKEDIIGRRASQLFAAFCGDGTLDKLSNGEYQGVHYYAGKWYLCNYDDTGKPLFNDSDLFCFAFALSDGEHNKSTSFPNIKTIVFDEFLTNKTYLVDEFVSFMNTVSTIVRRREDVKIYMLGNTVNKFCPYFTEMGLNHVLKMKQGTIDIYSYGDSKLTVAVEYCKSVDAGGTKDSHKYFAFNNPKLSMITGGAWEMDMYPHLPFKYRPKDILMQFFIDFNDSVYQCEVIGVNDVHFVYIHNKTTPIQNPETDLIYSLEYNPRYNYNRSLYKPANKTQQRILYFFQMDKVFYQNNDVGDAISNYLKICKKV